MLSQFPFCGERSINGIGRVINGRRKTHHLTIWGVPDFKTHPMEPPKFFLFHKPSNALVGSLPPNKWILCCTWQSLLGVSQHCDIL